MQQTDDLIRPKVEEKFGVLCRCEEFLGDAQNFIKHIVAMSLQDAQEDVPKTFYFFPQTL